MLFRFLLVLIVLLSIIPSKTTQAATPTPATISPAPKNEIEKIRQAVREKVKAKLEEITQDQPLKKGIVGTVAAIENQQLTLNGQNKVYQVTASAETVYIDTKKNKSSFDKIKVGQSLLCLGYLEPEGNVDVKRIIFIDLKNLVRTDRLVVGKIADFSQSTSVVLLIPKQDKDLQYQVKLTSKTEILDRYGRKLDVENTIKSGLLVAAIISPDPKINKTYVATKIIDLSPPPPTPSNAQ